MEENDYNFQLKERKYLFKILYLIRINLPSYEFVYIIMFAIKYVGLILFSFSITEWNDHFLDLFGSSSSSSSSPSPSFSPPADFEMKDFGNQKIESKNLLYIFLSKFVIYGYNSEVKSTYYNEISLIGIAILLCYILLIIFY